MICVNPATTTLDNCRSNNFHLQQGWPTSQRPKATFLTVLTQGATSCTWAHMNTTLSLPRSHTYLYPARYIANITHQHNDDRNLQVNHCCACYLVGFLAFLVLNNPRQICLVFRCCQWKHFFHMGVSQNRSMLWFHMFYNSRMKPGKWPHAACEPRLVRPDLGQLPPRIIHFTHHIWATEFCLHQRCGARVHVILDGWSWCQAKFLTSRHVRMHRVIFCIPNMLKNFSLGLRDLYLDKCVGLGFGWEKKIEV